MPADDDLLERSAERLFADHATPALLAAAERGIFARPAWDAIEDAGLSRALVPEDAGGFGLDPAAALNLLRIAGAHALPLPLAETMLAGWMLAAAGLPVPDGPLSVALDADLALTPTAAGLRLTGTARRVPWGRDVAAVAALLPDPLRIALVPAGTWRVVHGRNIAREPRDDLAFDQILDPAAVARPDGFDPAAPRALGAVMRSLQMAGALARLVAMTTEYAGTRVQFGRAIGKFQAVQQNIAVLAAASAAAGAAAGAGAAAFAEGGRPLLIAAAKIRAGEAAGLGAGIAHQVHGAIGFTQEHGLHFLTRRLWSWRDEFGSETEWSLLLGRHLLAAGPERLWPELTAA